MAPLLFVSEFLLAVVPKGHAFSSGQNACPFGTTAKW
jgi:hypothetical protein